MSEFDKIVARQFIEHEQKMLLFEADPDVQNILDRIPIGAEHLEHEDVIELETLARERYDIFSDDSFNLMISYMKSRQLLTGDGDG